MKQILLVLDGTEPSDQAAELALDWANRFGAGITALGVIDEDVLVPAEMVPIGGDAYKQHRDEHLLESGRYRVHHSLELMQGRCELQHIAVRCIQQEGHIRKHVLQEAACHDLVIVPGRRDGANEDHLQKMIHDLPRPVTFVPAERVAGHGILLGYGGGNRCAKALQTLIADDLQELGPIHVVSVAEDSVQTAEDHATRAVRFLDAHGVSAFPIAIATADPVHEVLQHEADRLEVELIAVGLHERPRLIEFFTGSVTWRLLHDSTRPVLVCS